MKFLIGKYLKFKVEDDQSEVLGSQHGYSSGPEASRPYLPGTHHEVRFKRILVSVILLIILLMSGALIMLLNHLLTG